MRWKINRTHGTWGNGLKRCLSLVLSVCLVFSMCLSTVFATEDVTREMVSSPEESVTSEPVSPPEESVALTDGEDSAGIQENGSSSEEEAEPLVQEDDTSSVEEIASHAALQTAIDNASTGDETTTIKVTGDFTLTGSILVNGKNILIQSAGDEPAVITASATSRHFSVVGASKMTLKNITLIGNESGNVTGGITISRDSSGEDVSPREVVLDDGATIMNCRAMTALNNTGGGVLVAAPESHFVMKPGSLITGCEAWSHGGGISIHNGAKVTIEGGTISNSSVDQATGGGGGIFLEGTKKNETEEVWSTLIMNGGEISGNIGGSQIYGAGVSVSNLAYFEMNGGTICDNKNSGGYGGGVCVVALSGGSAAIGLKGSDPNKFVMNDGVIKDNIGSLGAGVYAWKENTFFTMTGGEISGNKSVYGGGVGVDSGSTCVIDGENILIEGNSASLGGGISVFAYQSGGPDPIFEMKSGTIRNNTATSTYEEFGGGGIYAQLKYPIGDTVPINITGGLIENNQAVLGSGIHIRTGITYAADEVLANISGVTITNNGLPDGSDKSYGGGIYLDADAGIVNLSDSTVTNNTAILSGGGMAVFNGVQANVENTTFKQNKAEVDGGGIYYNKQDVVSPSTLAVKGTSVFTENIAGRNGGGICTMRNDVRDLTPVTAEAEVTFSKNKAEIGYIWELDEAGHGAATETHRSNIQSQTFTVPFTNAYSNYDINYDAGKVFVPYNLTVVADTGGTVDESVNGEYPEGYVVTITATPKSGYKFTGWTSDTAGGEFGNSSATGTTFTMPAANVILTAHFGKQSSPSTEDKNDYTVTYHPNGGDGSHTQTHSEGTTHVVCTLKKTGITREGYAFIEWNTNADGSGTSYDPSENLVVNRNVVLYAQWLKNNTGEVIDMENHYAYIVGYPDGNVGPEDNITRGEVASIFFRLLRNEYRIESWSTTNSFTDVESTNWYNNAISTLSNVSILKGYPDGRFNPEGNVTRAELAAIAARFAGTVPSGSDTGFSDTDGHWAFDEIEISAVLGYVEGYPDGSFRPDQAITRAEVMTLINNVLNRHVEHKDDLLSNMVTWPDNQQGRWYYFAVQEATNSHDYTRKADDRNEIWTHLIQAPNWTVLEHPGADPNDLTFYN